MLNRQRNQTKQNHNLRLAAFFVLAANMAFAAAPKVSKDLSKLPSTSNVGVIVQYFNPAGSADATAATAVGASNRRAFGKGKLNRYNMTPAAAAKLVAQSNVKYISVDRPIKGASFDTNITAVSADLATNLGYDGTGIGVAVIDSGVNPVNDLKDRVVYSENFDPSSNTTADLYGHGTHVAGIIAGSGASSSCAHCDVTLRGVAPNANIINLRVLDANGSATDSTVIAAIERAIELKNQYNIRVINLSLGRGVYESYQTDPLCQAVEDAWNAGIVVVVAAGNYGRDNSANNNGYGTITAPGNDPYAITVGAMKTNGTPGLGDDQIATYSSKGPSMIDFVVKPDLVAPGNLMVSDLSSTTATLYTQYPQNLVPISYYKTYNNDNASSVYYSLSGTSMASPMVSGAAALLLQKTPNLTPDQVKARLMKSASKSFAPFSSYTDPDTNITYNEQSDIFTVGAGYLDVYAALRNTDSASSAVGVAMSPTAQYDASTGQVNLVTGSSVLWGHSVLWGNSVVWGTSVLWGQSVLWGNSVCWGTSTSKGFSVIWGTSVIWGAKTNSDAMSIAIRGEKNKK